MYVGTPIKGKSSRAAKNLDLPDDIILSGPYIRHHFPFGKVTSTSELFYIGNDDYCFAINRYKRRYVVVHNVQINRFESLKLAVNFCLRLIKGNEYESKGRGKRSVDTNG